MHKLHGTFWFNFLGHQLGPPEWLQISLSAVRRVQVSCLAVNGESLQPSEIITALLSTVQYSNELQDSRSKAPMKMKNSQQYSFFPVSDSFANLNDTLLIYCVITNPRTIQPVKFLLLLGDERSPLNPLRICLSEPRLKYRAILFSEQGSLCCEGPKSRPQSY